MRLRDLAADAARRFTAAGIAAPEAALDAELLLRDTLGWDRAAWLTRRDEAASVAIIETLEPLIRRREGREPIAYIRGVQEFYGRAFAVGPGVLVPRPETELLIDAALAALAGSATPRLLDIGAGSGCVAVTLALERPDARLSATDVSLEALAWARTNAERHGVTTRIRWLHAAGTGGADGPFDLVVSNPPYVSDGDRETLAPEVRREPDLALFAGDDGLAVVRAITSEAHQVLRPGGALAMEIGAGQAAAAQAIVLAAGFVGVGIRDDLQGIPRVVQAVRR
jgi:release factor glutamine methyltransferase